MAATGDMSVVSREYEKSIINAWKNFVAGDIVRMVGRQAARTMANFFLLLFAVLLLNKLGFDIVLACFECVRFCSVDDTFT